MLRGLKTSDIFTMSKILKKMNLKVDLVDAEGKAKNQQQIGADFILSIFENIHTAEKEINDFLANLSGMTPQEFSELPIEKTIEIFDEFKKLPGLSNFFRLASR